MENRQLSRSVSDAKDAFDDLVSEIESLEVDKNEMQETIDKQAFQIDGLETRIKELEDELEGFKSITYED